MNYGVQGYQSHPDQNVATYVQVQVQAVETETGASHYNANAVQMVPYQQYPPGPVQQYHPAYVGLYIR